MAVALASTVATAADLVTVMTAAVAETAVAPAAAWAVDRAMAMDGSVACDVASVEEVQLGVPIELTADGAAAHLLVPTTEGDQSALVRHLMCLQSMLRLRPIPDQLQPRSRLRQRT